MKTKTLMGSQQSHIALPFILDYISGDFTFSIPCIIIQLLPFEPMKTIVGSNCNKISGLCINLSLELTTFVHFQKSYVFLLIKFNRNVQYAFVELIHLAQERGERKAGENRVMGLHFLYRAIWRETSVFWEEIISVIVREKKHVVCTKNKFI